MSKPKHRNSEVQRPTSGVIRGGSDEGRQYNSCMVTQTPSNPTDTRVTVSPVVAPQDSSRELAEAFADLPSDPDADPLALPSRAFPVAGCDACAQGGCWIHGYYRP